MSLVRRHDPAQGRRRLLIDLEQSALDGREAGGRLAVVARRLVDALEGREAVEDLRRGGRVDARAVEDAGPVYNRLIGSTPSTRTSPGEPDSLIDCHAANGRLQDVRRAPRPRGEPRRRDEQVEDVGPRGEAGGTDLCRNQDHNAIDATPARRRAPESVDFHAGARRAASRTSRAGGHTGAARIPRVGSTLPRRPKERRRWRRRLLRSPFSHVRKIVWHRAAHRGHFVVLRRARDCARTSPASARSAAPRCTHRAP